MKRKDSLFPHKIFGSVLVAFLVIALAGFFADIVYDKRSGVKETAAMPGDAPQSAASTQGAKSAAKTASATLIEPLLAGASIEKGKKIFARKCASCHRVSADGKNSLGPNLLGAFGQDIGSVAGYSYSKAMRVFPGVWNAQNLSEFLRKPRAFVKGTKMSFGGLKKDAQRADMIVYLRSLEK